MSGATAIGRLPEPSAEGSLSADATWLGDTVHTTVIPVGPDGEVVGETIQEQSRAAFDNLRETLEAVGSGLDRLLHLTIYLTDIGSDRAGFNDVYRTYLRGPVPVRCAVGVAALARPEMRVELTAIAARGA